MSEPIDLDLVEMRCRIRGWACERHSNRLHAWGPAGWVWFDSWAYGGDAVAQYGPLLTAPRWTLDRLLSEPPEGWRVVDHVTPRRRYWQALLAWGESYSEHNHELSCALGAHPQSLLSVTVNQTCASHADLARLAERHKAAAELALILAEVEPESAP